MLLDIHSCSLRRILFVSRVFSFKRGLNNISFFLKRYSNFIIKVHKAKKQLVTTLRAPKHFKVGRHHFHTSSRLVSLVYSPGVGNICFKFLSAAEFQTTSTLFVHLAPKHPLTKLSSVTSQFSCIFSISVR